MLIDDSRCIIVLMRIVNRFYKRDYEAIDTFEVGIVLNGAEVKSIRQGNLRLEQAFGKIIGGDAYLMNAEIAIYKFSRPKEYNLTRQRKLLLHKKEIQKIEIKLKTGGRLTLIPVSCYTKGRCIKLSIALAKGRGEIAKKKLERAEDVKRNQKQEMKEYLKK
ncbi:SsrA-binding protein [Candidatus Roizmanbacteria bacterium CG_4_9_14_0_2_um_filter_39_13]|uniref:SsrA-binding protein n=1 Tax=Candidatus Roizmanbacteria bacterium CG_4_9_14_0_2_um_filter_39_13 TaxID=1974839 RepID=A0A2M8EXF5_9BACT|nr:MAG: SsrA-binding protein [Candidatus Roizmanbacteria bacterium CG_4_10_14_0_2_um_filter_39_12]PJC30740.1 MAG: SsrA-binding protein [Candidatus Roizmanbacteria bacterium CG_4_9_14_0_2_um_filter_39_13]